MTASEARPVEDVGEIRDGMRIEWDVPIEMDDGVVLRADVYRPIDGPPAPVLLTYGPYGKGLRFSDHHPMQWERLITAHPEVLRGSSGKYQAWETPDPEKWVSFGYACVRVDSRGAGRSPGYIDPHSPREIRDTARCIEWAGTRPWSNGKVGINGISYYADNAWLVASMETPPPQLAAICAWEGSTDHYRESMRHGGIRTTFIKNWWAARILPIQHGYGDRGYRSPHTGEWAAGPETLTDAELAANRADVVHDHGSHELEDEWTRSRSAVFENIKLPFLSAANWGGAALHLRGNIEGFVRAASDQKWLAVHGREHWTHFYTDYGLDLQRRFFDCFLKGDASAWADQPRVLLNVRRPGEVFELRGEDDWPIPDTQWTRRYLLHDGTLAPAAPADEAAVSFDAQGDGVLFLTPPLESEVEITGPLAAKLFVSSSTTDADLFLVVHVFDPTGAEVTFQGTMDPMTCVAKGWLRASHRKLDPELTLEYRPYHTHDELQPLVPNEVYEVDVEVWPTCIVIPPGHRIGLRVLGHDYFHPHGAADYDNFGHAAGRNGSGGMLHDDPHDRPPEVFGGTTTIYVGPDRPSSLLLPVIPPRSEQGVR